MGLSDIGLDIRAKMESEGFSGENKSASDLFFGDEIQPTETEKPRSVVSESSFEMKEQQPEFATKSTEEAIATLKGGVEKLGEIGSKGIVALRTLFEQMRDKIKRRDVEKLEKEIEKIEDEKKRELEKAGLLKHKQKLEEQLKAIKSRKLEGLI